MAPRCVHLTITGLVWLGAIQASLGDPGRVECSTRVDCTSILGPPRPSLFPDPPNIGGPNEGGGGLGDPDQFPPFHPPQRPGNWPDKGVPGYGKGRDQAYFPHPPRNPEDTDECGCGGGGEDRVDYPRNNIPLPRPDSPDSNNFQPGLYPQPEPGFVGHPQDPSPGGGRGRECERCRPCAPCPPCPPCQCDPPKQDKRPDGDCEEDKKIPGQRQRIPEPASRPLCSENIQAWTGFDLLWDKDIFPRPGEPQPVTLSTNWDFPVNLTVTDDYLMYERFTITLDDDTLLGMTSERNPQLYGKPPGSIASCEGDADRCVKEGWSHGTFEIPAGMPFNVQRTLLCCSNPVPSFTGDHNIEISWKDPNEKPEYLANDGFSSGHGQYRFDRTVPCSN